MIIPYSSKPDPIFQLRWNNNSRSLTYGLEIEVDGGERRSVLVAEMDAMGMPLYHKEDGSLCHNGLEIITHPCSLDFIRYNLRLAEIGRLCRKHGYDSDKTTTCGLHVHVGRKQLGNNDEERLAMAAKLVWLVDSLWDNGLVKFTRRTPSQLHWCERPGDRMARMRGVTPMSAALRAGGQNGGHMERYTAVNLTNRSTVEFRIFRGSIKRDRIVASVELVDTLIHYAKHHTLDECVNAYLTLADVVAYDDYGNSYKELVAECRRLGIVDASVA